MGRIKETDRLALLDDHSGHWTEANALAGGPVVVDLNTVPPSTLTLAQFDSQDPYEVVIDGARLEAVRPLRHDQYEPRGGTPLFDAMGSLIDAAGVRHAR